MSDSHRADLRSSELRERALAKLAQIEADERPDGTSPPTLAERQATLHELQVHQIELELQNEELRRSQGELEASRLRWFELYDLAPVGYCTVSESGLILQVNLAAAELFGQARALLAKRRFSEFFHPDDLPTYYAFRAQLLGSLQQQPCELRLQEALGAERWVQLTATATEPDAQGQRSLRMVLQDVSERRKAQAAQAALLVAEQTQRSRSEFLSRVSHEFRTPLNAIIGFSHLLLHGHGPMQASEARLSLQHILEAGEHLLQMVADLLDVTRAESGRLGLQLANVDVLGVLRDALPSVASQARAAGVTVELETPARAAAGVNADPTRLRQVFLNLLTNAVKYNRAGGRVTVRLVRISRHWRVVIADNGMGMTPEQQAALFQPFNRLGREASDIEGTGLGLVIARDLVQAMGGRLTVQSEHGIGSEFLVDLVASDVPKHMPDVTPYASELRMRAEVTGRVLCVEDDPASRVLIKSLLEQRPGIDLEIVESGAACIAAARRSWPNLLLLDLRLPDMAGLDVLKVLRQLNPQWTLPCLVVSAECSADVIAELKAAGAGLHLAKPINPGELLSSIDGQLATNPLKERAPGGDSSAPDAERH